MENYRIDISKNREVENNNMPTFRHKPQIVEAYRLPDTGKSPSDGLIFFLRENGIETEYSESIPIKTASGIVQARPGDWIVKGYNNELYPCKNEIFKANYEVLV